METARGVFGRLVYLVIILFGLLTVMPVWWVVTTFMKDRSRVGWPMTPFHWFLFALLGVKVEASYPEGFDPRRSAVILSNHQSWLDIPLVTGWVRPVAFLAKKELYSIPLLGIPMRRVGCIEVARKDPKANAQIGPRMAAMMARGYSYGVFPEGTRTVDGTMNRFKTGIFKIVAGQPLEVWPVTIDGACRVMPKNRFGIFPGTVKVTVHEPIPAEEVAKMEWSELHDRVRAAIASALPAESSVS